MLQDWNLEKTNQHTAFAEVLDSVLSVATTSNHVWLRPTTALEFHMPHNKKQIHQTKTGKKNVLHKKHYFFRAKKHVKLLWLLPHFWEVFSSYSTLPESNSSPLKIGHPKRKFLFQPSIFGCFGRGTIIKVGVNSALTSNMRNCTSLALETGNSGFRVPPAAGSNLGSNMVY